MADKGSYAAHLPITDRDTPYRKVSVSSAKKKLIRQLGKTPGNGVHTIIAEARRQGVRLTKDEVLTVLNS